MIKRIVAAAAVFGFLFSVSGLSAAQQAKTPTKAPAVQTKVKKVEEKDLSPKHREFLQLTTYIITPSEKDVFFMLTNERDRDIFIDSFWKLRDPTPGTPENEYREEIVRRFNYANKRFTAGRPGWMTDRGRYYITLGEPASYDRFPGTMGIVPCEVWYYYTDGTKGLPTHFGLVFFAKGGSGDYRLYDPFVDGPKALMLSMASFQNIAADDWEGLYEKIRELAPSLADMSISMIPGEYGYGYMPSARSTTLIASIQEAPKANIKPTYALHFLDYKGMVSTEYMSNYIESEAMTAVFQDPQVKIPFLHFSIKPSSISVDYYEPKKQFYCAYSVSVSLRPSGSTTEDLVFQYTKDFPYYFAEDEVEKVRANGISIEDAFPVAEGKYKLIILLQNSVAKEFSVFEKEVEISGPDARPRVVGPFVGYRLQDYPVNVLIPFKVLDKKLAVDPKATFAQSDLIALAFNIQNATETLWREGKIVGVIRVSSDKPETKKTFEIVLHDSPFNPVMIFNQTMAARELGPAYYEAEVSLLDGQGRAVHSGRTQFVVTSQEAIGHPIARAKGFPLDNKFLYYGMLASQYAKIRNDAKAEQYYEQALALKPDYIEGASDYAQFLVRVGKFDRALDIAERLKTSPKLRFDYFLVRGLALMGQEKFQDAVANLLDGNKIYNSDTRVLNALGYCFYKLGQKTDALDVLKASLRLNPDQPGTKDLIARVEKELK